jgi:hypothetical protein
VIFEKCRGVFVMPLFNLFNIYCKKKILVDGGRPRYKESEPAHFLAPILAVVES